MESFRNREMHSLWQIGPFDGHCQHSYGCFVADPANAIALEVESFNYSQVDADDNFFP